ncbi:hypothetical protein HHK36_018399 [Tetracentron sinense]|uniref:Uncharacterized protein n=1 Tax=Tetracentron sinense TaxID=13715 RepID=A0A835DDI0_TETSI|nr:hypothetical protein HHK36_018399 [Tetracentron sinense]
MIYIIMSSSWKCSICLSPHHGSVRFQFIHSTPTGHPSARVLIGNHWLYSDIPLDRPWLVQTTAAPPWSTTAPAASVPIQTRRETEQHREFHCAAHPDLVAFAYLPIMGEEDPNSLVLLRLTIILIGFTLAAIAYSLICHWIIVGWCNRRRLLPGLPPHPHPHHRSPFGQDETLSNIKISMVQLILTYKYHQEMGFIGDDHTCAVCLSEFEA